jgi:hypothetical protein
MSADETRSKKVTFTTSLPLGAAAHFTDGNIPWIAVPAPKYADLCSVTDRLIGAVARALVQLELVQRCEQRDDTRLAQTVRALREAMNTAITTKGPVLAGGEEQAGVGRRR